MEFLTQVAGIFLHIDEHLSSLITAYGAWTYLLLFVVIFCETGLIVTPFLPGDSLIFAAGAFAATGVLNVWWLGILMIIAAIVGDTVNYSVGHWLGPKVFSREKGWFLRKDHLTRTQAFYEKHGPKTIILARFVPIVRTVAPFVAGIGKMSYPTFLIYNVVGAIVWVVFFLALGYGFGAIPIVKENFEIVIIGIIALSLLPGVWHFVQEHMNAKRANH